ncbi:PspA/IM30 family protein [Bacteroides intestinalis]|uniref:hypothetical protein n=1 Tax=Bacteroides intestinalis TaxID=329854 RepID=UPI00189DABC3|nr:hypothetical protein [Bacteroides intestinalis]
MNKKFLSAILFGALMVGSTGTFTSCKDYDDDIKDLQGQLDKKASLDELNSKVSALEAAINGAKTDATAAKTKAEEALTKAQEALDKAGQGGSSAEIEALKAALEKAQSDLQKQIDKLASLDDVTAKVAALKKELEADFVTDEKLQALSTKVQTLTDEVVKLIGHRLTSLAVIPTTHINGIAAITFTTLQYTPQKYQVVADHESEVHATTPVLDHVNAATKANYISTEKNKAYFHVSPSVGIRTQDIKLPSFDGLKSENIITRAGVEITNNKPIEVTGYNINDKGVLEVTFKKEKSFLNTQLKTSNPTGTKESFYMASLKAPIAEANYTEDEAKDLAAGKIDGVYVNSEYARIEELIKLPYLANMRTDYSKTTTGNFADETQTDANGKFYVHYHDSICLYKSDANSLIDVYQPYDKALDLKTLVKVCVSDINNDHSKHEGLDNYADYGLAFRFRLANAAYIPQNDNTNKTDQQKFAQIDSPESGIMTSKVYNIPESATAVGREPIVCVSLIDTQNGNALIAQRYIKIKWTMEGKTLSVPFQPTLFNCTVENRVNTEMMNTMIYDKAKTGGMTKNEFHSIYTQFVDGTGAGTAIDIANPEEGVESHNILWTLSETDLGVFWPTQQEKTFTKTVTYKDPKGINADITVVMTRTIYMPALNVWGHMGTYWKGDKVYEVFNINPIVYGTKESNPAWNVVTGTNPTCNIYTDLLNGFLDDRYKKPTDGAAGVVYYTDKNVAGKKFYYPSFGPAQAGATMGANSNGVYYNDLGVRFVFDKARIANYKYTWKDGKEYTATLKNNDTELWINGQLAATIVNHAANLLNAAEQTYNIKLEEAVPAHPVTDFTNQPTEAAKALVGKLVPINLVADICGNGKNVTTVKQYEANIIEPLQVKKGEIKNFIDAQNEGSTIDVTDAFTYYSWNDNNQVVAKTGKGDLAEKLYEFYQVREAGWPLVAGSSTLDVTKIKTNLKPEGGNLEPVEGYTQGSLPANVEIKYEQKLVDGKLKDVLTYYNYSGTPVNKAYKLFIPVEYGYKWKTLINVYEVTVAPNSGTPGN